MAAEEFFCQIVGINPFKLSPNENLLLETELFFQLCTELKSVYTLQHRTYFQTFNFNLEMEQAMIDDNFVKCIVMDLMNEYTIEGIALHTHLPEDVIYELATGRNTNPSLKCIRKIIELHRQTRPTLYHTLVKKIVSQHQHTDT